MFDLQSVLPEKDLEGQYLTGTNIPAARWYELRLACFKVAAFGIVFGFVAVLTSGRWSICFEAAGWCWVLDTAIAMKLLGRRSGTWKWRALFIVSLMSICVAGPALTATFVIP
jgi:hypothetical protein